MTLEYAIKLLEVEYNAAAKVETIKHPLAYALYNVWKRAERERK